MREWEIQILSFNERYYRRRTVTKILQGVLNIQYSIHCGDYKMRDKLMHDIRINSLQ